LSINLIFLVLLQKLDKDRDLLKQVQKLSHGIVDEEEEETEEKLDSEKALASDSLGDIVLPPTIQRNQATPASEITAQQPKDHSSVASQDSKSAPFAATSGAARAQDIINQLNLQLKQHQSLQSQQQSQQQMQLQQQQQQGSQLSSTSNPSLSQQGMDGSNAAAGTGSGAVFNFTCEFEINDYPQRARWKVTNKDQINQICDISGAAITTRGLYYAAGKAPKEGERKLYLFIEGETQLAVDKAKMEIARILREATLASVEMELKAGIGGRYSVV
jgi:ATP-dependent RNA helicase DDX46/PRP5